MSAIRILNLRPKTQLNIDKAKSFVWHIYVKQFFQFDDTIKHMLNIYNNFVYT